MDRKTERELMRLAHGELEPERRAELEAHLDRDPELRAALKRLERRWRELELPQPEAAPPGFAAAVAGRAMVERGGRLPDAAGPAPGWSPPGWAAARLAAAAALAAGVALGAFVGGAPTGTIDEPGGAEILAGVPTLAESYWLAASDPMALDLGRPGRPEPPDGLGQPDRLDQEVPR